MPRICILLPSHWSANLGGAEYQVRLLTERLVATKQFDIHYVARRVAPGFKPAGYALHTIPAHHTSAGTFLLDVPDLIKILRRLQPDVIYQRVASAYTGAAAWYAQNNEKRLIWHVSSDRDLMPSFSEVWRSPPKLLNKMAINYGARHANVVVVQNNEQARLLSHWHRRNDAKLIRNFHPLPTAPAAKHNNRLTVCWIGNLKTIKRPDLFIRLANEFRSRKDVEFLIAGAPQMRPKSWRAFAARMKDLPNVEYLGPLSLEDVEKLLAAAHVLVNTSPVEGFPNTFIQAWMRRVAVLSFAVNPDGVFDSLRCGLCANGSFEKLISGLERLLNDPTFREKTVVTADQHARSAFSERNLEQLVELCSAAL